MLDKQICHFNDNEGILSRDELKSLEKLLKDVQQEVIVLCWTERVNEKNHNKMTKMHIVANIDTFPQDIQNVLFNNEVRSKDMDKIILYSDFYGLLEDTTSAKDVFGYLENFKLIHTKDLPTDLKDLCLKFQIENKIHPSQDDLEQHLRVDDTSTAEPNNPNAEPDSKQIDVRPSGEIIENNHTNKPIVNSKQRPKIVYPILCMGVGVGMAVALAGFWIIKKMYYSNK